MELKCWYTYATEVLAYSRPQYKFILSIVKQHTATRLKKAVKNDGFYLLLPKDVKRHVPEIFKSSIRHLYKESLRLVEEIINEEKYITRKHICQYYVSINKIFQIDFSRDSDREFIKMLSPLYPWTFNHVFKYLTGKDSQVPDTVGEGAIIIIKLYKLNFPIKLTYKQAKRDSSQVKTIEIENITPDMFEFQNLVYKKQEYQALCRLIDYLYQK